MTKSEGTFHKMLKAREGLRVFYHTLANHGRGALSMKHRVWGWPRTRLETLNLWF